MTLDELLTAIHVRIPGAHLVASGGHRTARSLAVIVPDRTYPEVSRDDGKVRATVYVRDGRRGSHFSVEADDFATAAHTLIDLLDELTTQEPTS